MADHRTHLQVIAVVNLVGGSLVALGLLVTLASMLFAGGIVGLMPGMQGWAAEWVAVFALFMLLVMAPVAVVLFLAGGLLLKRRPAGRVLAYITAGVALFAVPLGTAYGVYAIWALSRPGMDQLLAAGQAPPAAFQRV